MPFTTPQLVREVIEVDEEEVPSLDPFITDANELVTEFCVKVPAIYTDARLARIETYLAAHFYEVRERLPTMQRADVVQESYELGKADFGLKLTWYGQQAMILDTKGALAALNETLTNSKLIHKKIDIVWLGTIDDDEV
jgi:hypothetical protein